ncbi:U-box domain-containing protein 52 [Bienertia sinuspersici]
MWLSKENTEKKDTSNQLVAVAIDRDKGSQHALKWAIDNLLHRGQTVVLVHVKVKPSYGANPHIIQCQDIVLEDSEVPKALIEFVTHSAVEVLIMGSASKVSEKTTPTESPFSGSDEMEFKQSVDRAMPPSLHDAPEERRSTNRLSTSSDNNDSNYDSSHRRSSVDTPLSTPPRFSNVSFEDNCSMNWSNMQSQSMEDVEAHMNRLKMELRQTQDMYSNARKEALTAKQKALELQRWKIEEERKTEDDRLSEELAESFMEKEKAKSKVATDASEAHRRLSELEAQKRVNEEMNAFKEADENNKKAINCVNTSVRYRRYSIEEIETATEFFTESRKIGEGGYGPVFRCQLDHTLVAVKVLRPDAAQGRSQFQQEVEVLSCFRHPNMVLLLGACPEYGCLVYEYMHNGSLEDRLFCRGGSPPLSWQHRFRIAAEIATGLLFLHQTKPEPLVHRDLKPANILLDRNLVAKISDVGLARLVPPSVADEVTQYRLTSTAGTFCYIDPEYQQTGMLGVKSDVYSLGIMLLQLITAKSPMGLAHHVERAIEKGNFQDYLDPTVKDWPFEEALKFAKLSLQCAELRRRDRPDLGTVLLPELCKLRNIAEESLDAIMFGGRYDASHRSKSTNSQVSLGHEALSGPTSRESGKSSNFGGD